MGGQDIQVSDIIDIHKIEKWNIVTIFILCLKAKEKGIPILSCLGVLNDDYDGGEFVMFEDFEIKLEQGDLLIFPSNFLYS